MNTHVSEPVHDSARNDATRRSRVALALGAGGAKGLAYIGAIEELVRRDIDIVAIAGSSMGSVIGGIHATGKLDVYRDWVLALAKLDVLRLVDWSLTGGGLIKGERIIGTLRELIGETRIEDLPLSFTAVATDLEREREVWLVRGPLFDAIRASIAIPTVFRPHLYDGRRLVDGALLNPVPVTPLLREDCDYIIAVSVDGEPEAATPDRNADAHEDADNHYRQRIGEFIGRLVPHTEKAPREPGAIHLLMQSMDLMQSRLAQMRLAAYQPDLLIQLPRNIASAYEFYRARELIERGRESAAQALDRWRPAHGPAAKTTQ